MFLYILYTRLFSNMSFGNVFSKTKHCCFISLMKAFESQKFFILIESSLFFLLYLGIVFKKSLPNPMSQKFTSISLQILNSKT